MTPRNIQRALISVYDKTGVVDFARTLHEEFGIEIIATGGTASLLEENGIPVTRVEQITGFGQMLGGRVKTLHPKIFGAILADRDNPEHMQQLADAGIKPIDMVVVNLYPFERTVAEPGCTFEQAIEMIDIGGPSLLRAAAKNHRHVVVVANAERYPHVLPWIRTGLTADQRQELAADVFDRTESYDLGIQAYLSHFVRANHGGKAKHPGLSDLLISWLAVREDLRYGENPHQSARRYDEIVWPVITGLDQVAGDAMSFNNYVDADAALRLGRELTQSFRNRSAVAFIKHTNPCGCAVARSVTDDPSACFDRAYLGDANAAMGGILVCNFDVTADVAAHAMGTYDRVAKVAGVSGFFVEVWIAPTFTDDAVRVVRDSKTWGKRTRLLAAGDLAAPLPELAVDVRPVAGGAVAQTPDQLGLNEEKWYTVTDRPPTDQEMSDLRLAWLIAKHTKSNAISLVREGQLIGNGAGQMSRVMSCRVAAWLAEQNGHLRPSKATARRSERERSPVAASDAFFPFRDGPDILIDAGVTAIIQPGGSKRDPETIAACNERGVAMVFTQTRHLRH